MPSGFWVVAAIKILIILGGIVLFVMAPRKHAESLKSFFLTPGLVFFVIGILLAFWLPVGLSFRAWDEFSWWGWCLKCVVDDGTIPLISKKIVSPYLNYPPGTQIASYLFFRIWSAKFSEFLCYVCNNMIAFSALSTFFRQTRWHDRLYNCALGCVLIVTPCYFGMGFYSSIYVDAILGVVFATAAFAAVKKDNDLIDSVNLLLICSFLLLIKRSASSLVLFVLLMPIFYSIKDFVIELKNHRKIRLGTLKEAYRLLPMLSYLISWSWALAFKHYYTSHGAFEVSHINAKKIFEALYYRCPATTQPVIDKFLPSFFISSSNCFIPTSILWIFISILTLRN